jgi:hypothetical protein
VLAAKVAALSKNSRRFAAIRTSVEIVYNSVFNYKRIVTAESLISFRKELSDSSRSTRRWCIRFAQPLVRRRHWRGYEAFRIPGVVATSRAPKFQIHYAPADQT